MTTQPEKIDLRDEEIRDIDGTKICEGDIIQSYSYCGKRRKNYIKATVKYGKFNIHTIGNTSNDECFGWYAEQIGGKIKFPLSSCDSRFFKIMQKRIKEK